MKFYTKECPMDQALLILYTFKRTVSKHTIHSLDVIQAMHGVLVLNCTASNEDFTIPINLILIRHNQKYYLQIKILHFMSHCHWAGLFKFHVQKKIKNWCNAETSGLQHSYLFFRSSANFATMYRFKVVGDYRIFAEVQIKSPSVRNCPPEGPDLLAIRRRQRTLSSVPNSQLPQYWLQHSYCMLCIFHPCVVFVQL